VYLNCVSIRHKKGLHKSMLQVRRQHMGPVELPPSLRNNVAVLNVPNEEAPGGNTEVFLLGMSHVSKKSVQQV
jgi:hypothetical protein